MNLNNVEILKEIAPGVDWENCTAEAIDTIIKRISGLNPSKKAWEGLLEIFEYWNNTDDINQWIDEIEPIVTRWPWQIRTIRLGNPATRNEKKRVYRLAGFLHIENIEDIYGQNLSKWAEYTYWCNLQALRMFKIETETDALKKLLNSPYLSQLQHLEFCKTDCLKGNIEQLFSGDRFICLKHLSFADCELKKSDLDELATLGFANSLLHLGISSNYILPLEMKQLFTATNFVAVEALDLCYSSVTVELLNNHFKTMAHPSLKRILIKGTEAGDEMKKDVFDLEDKEIGKRNKMWHYFLPGRGLAKE